MSVSLLLFLFVLLVFAAHPPELNVHLAIINKTTLADRTDPSHSTSGLVD